MIQVRVTDNDDTTTYEPQDYHIERKGYLTLLWYDYDDNNDRDGVKTKMLIPKERVIRILDSR